MQQLQFESSWAKALSAQDRESIEKLFYNTKQQHDSTIVFFFFLQAINHRNELLVTVLVHNFSQQPLQFENTRLVYSNEQEVLAENVFTLPTLTIPPQVSMPWTFIFPVHQGADFEDGRLVIKF